MSAAAKKHAPPGASAPRVTPTAIKREVDAALRQVADDVAAMPAPYIKAMGPVLAQAQRETTEALAAWLSSHPADGSDRFTAQRLRQAQLQLRAALIHAEKRIPAQLTKVLKSMGAEVGAKAMRDLQLEVSVMAGAFGHSVRPLQLPQAAILAEGRAQLIPQFENSAARYGKSISGDIRHQLAVGVAKGETFDELTTRLVKIGGPSGMVALRGKLGDPGVTAEYIGEGLFKRYRFWAERVVRTECSEAYSIHALNGLEAANDADPGYEKRWDAALIRERTCPVCLGLDGIAVALGADFPGGYKHPPAHPLCLCTLTPWRPEWSKASTGTRPPTEATQPKPPAAPPPPEPPPPPREKPPKKPPPPPKAKAPAPIPPAPIPPPAPPKPPHVAALEHLAAGDWSAARAEIQRDMAGDGFAFAPQTATGTTTVKALPLGVGGLHYPLTGNIEVAPKFAKAATEFSATVAAGHMPTSDKVEGMHVLVHEIVHGSGPAHAQTYKGVGVIIEEVSTELAARQYMAARFGRSVPMAYNDEIRLVRNVAAAAYGVAPAEAAAMADKAAVAFRKHKKQTGSIREVIRLYAAGFPAGKGRAGLAGFLRAYHQRVTGSAP